MLQKVRDSVEKETLSTSSFSQSLTKLLLFTTVICIELICGYSATDLTPFYLTALVQAINNIYDASVFIDAEKCSIFLLVRQAIIMVCSSIAIVMSICYMFGAKPFIGWLSSVYAVRITAILIGVIVGTLIYETLKHLVLIYRFDKQKKYRTRAKKVLKDALYYDCGSDEADSWIDLVSTK